MRKVKQLILLGGHIQALGLARQAAAMGIQVVLFIEDAYSVARFSTTISHTVVFKKTERLMELLKPYYGSATLLFPTSDNYVEFLAENEKILSNHFQLGIPNKEWVDVFTNKRNAYKFINKLVIPQPKSWLFDTLDEVKEKNSKLKYPVIVKPAIMHEFHRLFGKKAFRCNSKDELIAKCSEIITKIPMNRLLVQEFLAGGPHNLYSYGVFAIAGEAKAWVIANRIRQNPMDFGNSTTFAVTCFVPEIEHASKQILAATDYTGLAEIEFMYDEREGIYKFLEINTRAWKWHSISMGLGFGFLSEWVSYLNGEDSKFESIFKQVAWTERLTDYAVIAKEIAKGKMRLREALKTYMQKKVSAVWSLSDPLPAIIYLLLSPILFVKRH